MNLNEYVFSVLPWGREVSAVAAAQKEAHRMVWESLPDFYKNNCVCLQLVDEGLANERQIPGVSSSQFQERTA